MSESSGLAHIFLIGLDVAVVLAIPLVIIEYGMPALHRFGPKGFFAIPLMGGLSKLLGLCLGILLIASRYDRRYFDLHELFVANSPWNLSLKTFLIERVNPFNYGLGPLFTRLESSHMGDGFTMGTVFAGLLLAGLAIASFRFWRGKDAHRAIVCALLTAFLVTYLTVYAISLLLWVLFLLNFWTFGLLVLALQYYRNKA